MELQLFNNTTVGDVKRQFAKYFSPLKIKVFARPCASRTGSLLQQRLNNNTCLSQIKTVWREGTFSFSPFMAATEFEGRLQSEVGLWVQVFSKSGDLLLEPAKTDKLPLETQNDLSKVSGRPMRVNAATLFL